MRLARKFIDWDALAHNYCYMKSRCPEGGRVLAVIKSDAYGHGLVKAAKTLSAAAADGFAVAVVGEGLTLRKTGITQLILIMQGALSEDEWALAAQNNLAVVVHSFEQLVQLERRGAEGLTLWVEFDTGMNRFGFPADAVEEVLTRVKRLRSLSQPPVLMSHFAYADEADMTAQDRAQWALFETLRTRGELAGYAHASIANSAGALCRPKSQLNWVRAGIALYGALPVTVIPEHAQQFKPVMRVTAPVIAMRSCKAGERIGYGGDYTFAHDTPVAIVGIGYGDGYPRHARSGTPVWLGGRRCALVGRVSMDAIAVSLMGSDSTVAVGDFAELWGAQLPVTEVAAHCDTISYELLCAAQRMEEEIEEGIEAVSA